MNANEGVDQAVQGFRAGVQRHAARLRAISDLADARLQHPAERDTDNSIDDWLDDIDDKLDAAYADTTPGVRRVHLVALAADALAAVEAIDRLEPQPDTDTDGSTS